MTAPVKDSCQARHPVLDKRTRRILEDAKNARVQHREALAKRAELIMAVVDAPTDPDIDPLLTASELDATVNSEKTLADRMFQRTDAAHFLSPISYDTASAYARRFQILAPHKLRPYVDAVGAAIEKRRDVLRAELRMQMKRSGETSRLGDKRALAKTRAKMRFNSVVLLCLIVAQHACLLRQAAKEKLDEEILLEASRLVDLGAPVP